MTNSIEYVLAVSILLAIVILGITITLANERVRRATLKVRDVAHDYALADLALRRDQARRNISLIDQSDCLKILTQVALDAGGNRPDITHVSIAPGETAALLGRCMDGSAIVFTPAVDAFCRANPASSRRNARRYAINGLVSNPFVVEELEAVARWYGLTALPRTEEWGLLIMPSQDDSLLPKQGFARWLRFGWR